MGNGELGGDRRPMTPLSTEFAIREAIKLLVSSRRNFKSRQVEQARELLETLLELSGEYDHQNH